MKSAVITVCSKLLTAKHMQYSTCVGSIMKNLLRSFSFQMQPQAHQTAKFSHRVENLKTAEVLVSFSGTLVNAFALHRPS